MQDRDVERDEERTVGAVAGDWFVVPGPLNGHQWHWGRITAVLPAPDGTARYRVRRLGEAHDSVVVPADGARVAKEADWPEPAGDAIGVWPS
ncbi:DUF1918 domain-containing protein [Pseudonocardia humida]|uniref:DUF1918 domain-containing protein n=1 Tax=Pseudonocardia humida TaxID=2800819 RepID=A0ABT1A012_9PSEU|nr:DUF1918 domain-containing protein [Pseudonocardia humida]MCO1656333.1 DUF1918 domain-containing protein [Pseudonocardia humida]